MTCQPLREELLTATANGVQAGDADRERRLMLGEQHRPTFRAGILQPVQLRRRDFTPFLAGDHRIEQQQGTITNIDPLTAQ